MVKALVFCLAATAAPFASAEVRQSSFRVSVTIVPSASIGCMQGVGENCPSMTLSTAAVESSPLSREEHLWLATMADTSEQLAKDFQRFERALGASRSIKTLVAF